jgi:hypothetical protein
MERILPFLLSTRLNQRREMERIRFPVFPSCANPKGRESLDIYIYMKKKREFSLFWTKIKRERARAFHATASLEEVMSRDMKELEKSREEKKELTKGCCPREKKMNSSSLISFF